MQNYRLTTWLMLGYLALLLNFGPSAHHADFLGLHGRAPSDNASAASSVVTCSCCHHYSKAANLSATDSAASDSFPAEVKADKRALSGDCLFCQYFDQFNAVVASFKFDLKQVAACDVTTQIVSSGAHLPIASSARGPPIFLLG
jgi:hypothetical protein